MQHEAEELVVQVSIPRGLTDEEEGEDGEAAEGETGDGTPAADAAAGGGDTGGE